jgi:hypothetical protein
MLSQDTCNPAKIRTGNFPNTYLERYFYKSETRTVYQDFTVTEQRGFFHLILFVPVCESHVPSQIPGSKNRAQKYYFT